jgi:hypothetical protein
VTSEQAAKLTLAVAVLGMASVLYTGRKNDFRTNYRRVWGLGIVTAGGAMLADLAPRFVGPYMLLVLVVLLAAPNSGVGKLFAAGVKAANPSTSTSGGAS